MSTNNNSIGQEYLNAMRHDFTRYKTLGDKTFAQLNDEDFYFKPNEESNSIAILVQHISGNLISRMTDFLTTDGEKSTRNRDAEFEEGGRTKDELIKKWNESWSILFGALDKLTENDLLKNITIHNEPHTVIDALIRYDGHYASHVGQILMLGKIIKNKNWNNLSVPKKK